MIYHYAGKLGQGKSYGMFQHAFELIEKRKRSGLVTNQEVDLVSIQKYAADKKYWHLYRIAREGRVYYSKDSDLQKMLSFKNSVVLLDEVNLYFNARDWKDIKEKHPDVWKNLLQQRKIGTDMVWAAQKTDKADPFLLGVTNWFIYCEYYAFIRYWVRHYFDDEENYYKWLSTKRSFKYRMDRKHGFLNFKLANCYNSNALFSDESLFSDVPALGDVDGPVNTWMLDTLADGSPGLDYFAAVDSIHGGERYTRFPASDWDRVKAGEHLGEAEADVADGRKRGSAGEAGGIVQLEEVSKKKGPPRVRRAKGTGGIAMG